MAAAYTHGITKGVTTSTYNPWAYITRAQSITMAVRAMQNLYPGELDSTIYWFDSPWGDFSPDHGRNAAIAGNNYLYQGLPDYERLSPWDRMPREEVAQLLYNLQDYLPRKWIDGGFGEALRIMGPRLLTVGSPYVHPAGEEWATEGHEYVAVDVTLVNQSSSDWEINVSNFTAEASNDQRYDWPEFHGESHLSVEEIAPGSSLTGLIIWEIPDGAQVEAVTYGDYDHPYTAWVWR